MVNVLYQENDWVYVISESSQQEGFIPHSYCAPHGSQLGDLALSVKVRISSRRCPGTHRAELTGRVRISSRRCPGKHRAELCEGENLEQMVPGTHRAELSVRMRISSRMYRVHVGQSSV